MKFLVLSVCVAGAAALPSFYGLVAHPNGAVVPVDEPAVAAARAQHLDLLAAAHGHHAAPLHHAGPALAHHAVPAVAHHGYAGPLNLNTQLVGHPNGAVVPLDEPAVAAARADHFAAGGGHGDHAYVAHAPVAAYHGYAAVAHHAAPAVVAHHVAPVVAHHAYAGPLNLNTQLVGHPNGAVVPVDEPAVVAARAAHFAAGGGHDDHAYVAHAPVAAHHAAPVLAHHGYAAVAHHAAPVAHYGLVAHPNGAVVPVDEPAVVAARAAHFAAGGGHHY